MGIINIIAEDGSDITIALNGLFKGEDSRKQILKQFSKEIMDSEEPIFKYPHEQLIALAMDAIKCKAEDGREYGFANDEEAYIVGNIFCKHIRTKKIIPRVTDYYRDPEDIFNPRKSNLELGEKCLVCLSLFNGVLEERSRRYQTPKPEFYEQVGISEFKKEGFKEIAENFRNWTKKFQDYVLKVKKQVQTLNEARYLINPEGA